MHIPGHAHIKHNFCLPYTFPQSMACLAMPLPQGQGPPLRMPNGISRNRLSLILAVLSKHARLRMHAIDCHTNVVGGLQVESLLWHCPGVLAWTRISRILSPHRHIVAPQAM